MNRVQRRIMPTKNEVKQRNVALQEKQYCFNGVKKNTSIDRKNDDAMFS